MPPPLPDELVEEVLLRLPPENPAGLVRAGLVCTRWCRLVSDPGFRRRFREFHRSPPMLGMLCDLGDTDMYRFVPTTAFCSPHADRGRWDAVDARHGRVLLLRKGGSLLVVWDPITDEVRELPFPPKKLNPWTAAVVCSTPGACAHLDCHRGPFLVVLVGFDNLQGTLVYTYSSDAAAWSEPACDQFQQQYMVNPCICSVLAGNALYFGNMVGRTALKYDLESCQLTLILLPSLPRITLLDSQLTETEDVTLGLVNKDDSKLYLWSRKDTHEVDATWENRAIRLKTVFPVGVDVTKLRVIGSGDGIIFMRTDDEVYTIDPNTYKVKKVYEGTADKIIPYMSFYTPVLRVGTTGEGLGAGASTAEQA